MDGTWNECAITLPEDCRPKYTHIFNLNWNKESMRVDVRKNGCVEYRAKGASWMSLSGIRFLLSDSKGTEFTLKSPWKKYGGKWAEPKWVLNRIGSECIVSGLVRRSDKFESTCLAILPLECRPYHSHLYFDLN